MVKVMLLSTVTKEGQAQKTRKGNQTLCRLVFTALNYRSQPGMSLEKRLSTANK